MTSSVDDPQTTVYGDDAPGEKYIQAILDQERHPVPASLRATSKGHLDPVDIAPSRYFDPEFHRLEVERVWSHVWQMACREEQIPEVGDSIVYDLADTSLIVVRTEPDTIRAYHNACLHRGTMLRLGPGKLRRLRCPFHGMSWNLDGTLQEIPCDWDFPDLERSSFCLPQAKVGTWGGFVFVNLDADAPPLEEYLQVLPEHFATWPLEDRYLAAHVVATVPCNWKVALEAFIEAYHTKQTHPQLLQTAADSMTEYDVYSSHVSRMITAVGVQSDHLEGVADEDQILRAMLNQPEASVEPGKTAREAVGDRVRASLQRKTGRDYSTLTDAEALDGIEYFLFPNFMPWAGILTPLAYRFRPNGNDPDSSIIDVMVLEPVPKDGPRPKAAKVRKLGEGEMWRDVPELGPFGKVFQQDAANFGRVQRGLRATARKSIVLSRYQESRIRHFHATLDDYLARPDAERQP